MAGNLSLVNEGVLNYSDEVEISLVSEIRHGGASSASSHLQHRRKTMDWRFWVVVSGLAGILLPNLGASIVMSVSLRKWGHHSGLFGSEWRQNHWETSTRSVIWQWLLMSCVAVATFLEEAFITCSLLTYYDWQMEATMVLRCTLLSITWTWWSLHRH